MGVWTGPLDGTVKVLASSGCVHLYCGPLNFEVKGQLHKTTGFCRIFATELEDRRPKTVPYLEEVVE